MTNEQRNNDIWFLRFRALADIAHEAKCSTQELQLCKKHIDYDNHQMGEALARIVAILHNEQEDEERLEDGE